MSQKLPLDSPTASARTLALQLTWIVTLIFFNLPVCIAESKNPSLQIKDLPISGQRETSITIQKWKPKPSQFSKFSILKDTQEIEGDPSVSSKDARQNWKNACSEWKTETKELNKKNEIISLDCGHPTLSKEESGQKSYHSTGKYQIKVQMRMDADGQPITPDQDDDDSEDDELDS
jgi:hypothetical protein